MEFKIILAMLAFTATTSLANPLQTYINNRVICAGLPNGHNFCTDDCQRHVRCISGLSVTIEDCTASGRHCYQFSDGSAPVCSSVSQCGGPINCVQAGEFPDPDKCEKYHTCSSPSGTSIVNDCVGAAYNIATNACDLPVNNPDVCGPEGPVPECTVKGQVGALTQNSEYYFICILTGSVLYPGLYKCPGGYIYNPVEKICKSILPTTTSTTTATTTVESTTTVSTTITTIPTESTTSSTTAGTTTETTTPTESTTSSTTAGTTTVTTTPTESTTAGTTTTSSPGSTISVTTSTDTSTIDTSTTTSSGTSTSLSTTSVQTTTTDSASTTLPPVEEPFDYTVTIAVGTTVAVVIVIGAFVAGVLYIRRRKMKKPQSRKLF